MWPNGIKNHFFLLRIFEELAKRDKRYFLYMAGDGSLRPIIDRTIKEQTLQDRVSLPGLCDDVPSLMIHAFDVHLLPSLYEGLPVAGLEAAAAGLFTVCSDTITKEFTEQLSSRVKAISLKAPVTEWADEVEKALSKKISVQEGISIIQDSEFSIESSFRNLIRIYRNRLETDP
jgi:glycosyltransferase involved in cell wall biosynthesis